MPEIPAGISPDLSRRIGVWAALSITIGVTIGSGIFQTPGSIAREVGSPALILVLWGVGGVLSVLGAIAFAELAAMFPRSGGIYNFLREAYGPGVAFVFGWTYLLLTKPFAAAGIAFTCAEYLHPILGWERSSAWITTCGLLIATTLVNLRRVEIGSGVSIALTLLKVLALVAIVLLALAVPGGDGANLRPVPTPGPLLLAMGAAMSSILWTYDGWSDLGSIAGEVRDPARNLPRIYLLAALALTAIYLAVNAVYLWVVPIPVLRDPAALPVATLTAERLGVPRAATVIGLIVVLSTFGATHAAVTTGARVTFGQARDGLLFRFLARISPRTGQPAVSLWVQLAMSLAAVLVTIGAEQFAELAGGFVFTMWIFYGLAALAVIVLRVRRPDAPRPFRCWGYPVVPLLFAGAAVAMTALSIADNPGRTLPWLGVLIAGLPVYLVWRRWTTRAGAGGTPARSGTASDA